MNGHLRATPPHIGNTGQLTAFSDGGIMPHATSRTMPVTESQIDASIMDSFPGVAQEGADLLGIEAAQPPHAIVEAIHRFVHEAGEPDPETDVWTEFALPLGTLWGEQLRRHFGWEWASVIQHDHDDFRAIGVFSTDRSLAIYPWYFVLGCLERGATSTILLAFNMLDANKIPPQPPRSYTNVMDGVHHIVPPG